MRYLITTCALAAFLASGTAFAQTAKAQTTTNGVTASASANGTHATAKTSTKKAKRHHRRHAKKTANASRTTTAANSSSAASAKK